MKWKLVANSLVAILWVGIVAWPAWKTIALRGETRHKIASFSSAHGEAAASTPPAPLQADVDISDAAVEGAPERAFALVEFSDFQCPYCGRYARETYPLLKREFIDTGRIAYAFINVPLDFHAFARGAAKAGECARRQGRFWEMHDLLFSHQNELDDTSLLAKASSLRLEPKQLSACLAADAATKIDRDLETARKLGVDATPTFGIGRTNHGVVHIERLIHGAAAYGKFRAAVEEVLGN